MQIPLTQIPNPKTFSDIAEEKRAERNIDNIFSLLERFTNRLKEGEYCIDENGKLIILDSAKGRIAKVLDDMFELKEVY